MATHLQAAGRHSGRRWPKLAASSDIVAWRSEESRVGGRQGDWESQPVSQQIREARAALLNCLKPLPRRVLIAAIHVAVAMMLVVGFPDLVPSLQAGLQRTLGTSPMDGPPMVEEAQAPAASEAQPVEAAVPAGPQQEAAAQNRPALPDVNGMVILIRTTLAALDQANRTNNYSVLREIAAPQFQEANSAARLSDLFRELRSKNVDLAPAAVINPRLVSEPAIDGEGILRLTGFFPSRPLQVNFDLAFQPLNGRWLLFGLAADVVPNDASAEGDAGPAIDARPSPSREPVRQPAIPDAAIVASLVRNTVMALNQANKTGNYSVFRDISAPGFQEANSHSGLSEIFAALRARNLDLGPVAVIAPELFRPPTIDERGMLRLSGYFPSQPEQVNFDLAFQLFGSEWRLFGIGLNTSREVEQTAVAPAAPRAAGPAPLPRPRPSGP